MSKKLNFISLVQVIGTILIVLSHSVSKYIQYPSGMGMIVNIAQNIGLTAFMWCSGYLLVYTDSLHRKGYVEYIKTRAFRLMIPYIVVQLVMIFPKLIVANIAGVSASVDVLHAFLYPREGILPHLWFLPTLMILCLLSNILDKVVESKTKAACTLAIAAFIALLPHITNILAIDDVRQYLFWYVLGMAAAKYMKAEFIQGPGRKWYMLTAIPLYAVIMLFVPESQFRWLLCGLCSLTVLLTIGIALEDKSRLDRFAKYTFPIYILSLPAQNLVEVLAGRIIDNWLVTTISMFVVGIIAPVFVAIIVEYIEKSKNVKVLSRCIGL